MTRNRKGRASVVEVLEVIVQAVRREGVSDPLLDELFDQRTAGGKSVTLATLKEALQAYTLLNDPKVGAALSARLHSNSGLVSWRQAYAGGPVVPRVVVRLDRYIEQLDIAPPDEKAENGRRYSSHHVRVVYEPDRVIVYTDRLATDVDPVGEEEA